MWSKLMALDGTSEQPRIVRKTMDDLWREIVAAKKSGQQPKKEMMTLEDFLLKAGAAEAVEASGTAAVVEEKEDGLNWGNFDNKNCVRKGVEEVGLGRGRGKRSLSLSEPLDKEAEQRGKRMIRNRESAAKSRVRKQAYEAKLELMAVRLEEENDDLLREKAEHMKKRLKQLKENVIPVTETPRPPGVLRKVGSMPW